MFHKNSVSRIQKNAIFCENLTSQIKGKFLKFVKISSLENLFPQGIKKEEEKLSWPLPKDLVPAPFGELLTMFSTKVYLL